jgi:UDP-N-acetylmuramoyl-L-alanyl-D-glutamate--2,6-diaminopimelate ligase
MLNADDPHHRPISAGCTVPRLTYGAHPSADYRLLEPNVPGRLRLRVPASSVEVFEADAPLVGDFNRWNLAAASAVALRLGVPHSTVAAALTDFPGVPGRLERISEGQPFDVFVDFAHTPNGLRAALTAVRALGADRVIVLLGHPGGRDPANRPALAQAAAELAEVIVLTSDDPYDEEPHAILDQIEAPLRAAAAPRGRLVLRVPDRRAAIVKALDLAQPGDAVLLAGRGHLAEMTTRGQSVPFSDREIARAVLQRHAA